jgi:adenylate cyclase
LSAIVFTDIFGYSALVQADESKALEELEEHNRLVRASLKTHGGREVKTVGDSFLLDFESALDATLCAIDIQRAAEEKYESRRSDDNSLAPFRVRIGIHLGDVVHRDSDVLGDTVNITSRIQQLADPGGICVSEQVYSQIRNKIGYAFESLDPIQLKNIRFGVPVYRIVITRSADRARVIEEENESLERRIAVLPFVNMSPNREDEYFAEGLTEELITRLALLRDLKVISRTSVMHYKDSGKGISEIAKELRVANVLEGSVRKSGSRIRITAQLIDAATEDHLWTDRFDLELNDIFEVQDQIAMKVVEALKSRFYEAPPTTDEHRKPTENVVAYTLYLRGRYLWNKRTKDSVEAALEFFKQATELDPNYARAYSGIADCYSIFSNQQYLPPKEFVQKAREACTIALKLDDGLAEAHASYGLVLFDSYDYTASESEFKRAIQLNPSYASAHQWYSSLLLALGRFSEAMKEIKLAEESDPISSVILSNLSSRQWISGDKVGALETLDRAIKLDSGNAHLYVARAEFLAMSSRREEAMKDLRSFEALQPDGPMKKGHIAYIYAELGDISVAKKEIVELIEISKKEYVSAFVIALLYAYVGDIDQAFEWSFKSIEDGSIETISLRIDPTLEKMRGDPRFRKLMAACNLEY